jgi:predicted ATPase
MKGIKVRIGTQEIELPMRAGETVVSHGPQYHALIGPNGTYKSEILSAVAAYFSRGKSSKFIEVLDGSIGEFAGHRKVIALSTSPFCKFPVAKSVLSRVKRQSTKEEKTVPYERYVYLGTKSTSIYTSNLQERLYDLLLRTAIAAVQQKNLSLIQKTFDFLNFEREVLFRFRLKFELDNLTSTIKKRVAKADFERINEFMRSSKFREFFRPKIRGPEGATFQLDFRSSTSASKLDIDFFINMEILRKARLLDILEVIVRPVGQTRSSPVVYDLSAVSSGKSSLLLSFLGLSAVAEDGALILIDEPEIGLHPGVQIKYVAFLDELLSGFTNLQLIIATHSPHVLSSLPRERSQVLSLKTDGEGRLLIKRLRQSIQGWSAEDVLLDVFGVSSTRSLDVANHAMMIAEMIAEIAPFDAESFAGSLERIKALDLPTQDALVLLAREAEAFLERRGNGA